MTAMAGVANRNTGLSLSLLKGKAMTKLVFEPVDHIQAATGENHYYRAFQDDEGWVLYIHKFNDEGVAGYGVPVGTRTYESALVFAQAFEEGTADLMSARILQATLRVFSKPSKEG